MAATLLLDLVGSLVDSVPDLTSALNRLMISRSLPAFSREQVTRMVGDGAAVLTHRAFATHGREPDATAITDFVTDYTAHVAVGSVLYPGVLEALTALRAEGWRLAVCTNKPEKPARDLLDVMGLAPLICAVGGGDSFPVRKPDGGHVLATLALAGGEVGSAVLVGDHHNDVESGRRAGIPVVFAAWGYGVPSMAQGCAGVAQTMTEAAAMARRLLD